jgi:hypothetical protein
VLAAGTHPCGSVCSLSPTSCSLAETCLLSHWLRYAFDYHARGALFYAIISSVKNYGSVTFYLDLAETPDGEWLDGGKNYKLVVPPKVPVRDF